MRSVKPSIKQVFQRNRVYFYSRRLSSMTRAVETFIQHHTQRNILTSEEKDIVEDVYKKLKYLRDNRKANYYKKKQEIFKDGN